MPASFDITARLQIQGPNNITPVVNSIRRQLGGLSSAVDIRVSPAASRGVAAATASVNNLAASLASVQAASRQVTASMKGVGLPPSSAQSVQDLNLRAAAAVRQIQAMQKATGGASSEMFKFGEQIGLAFRRFLAFQIGAIVGIGKLISSLGSAAREAAEFQKTMVGLSQLGSSTAEVGGISAAISDLSRNLGVSSKELSQATIYLKGAGMSADEVRAALEALAKTSLSPTFDSIRDTTEAIIAMRQQFGVGAGEYEKYLGSINQVSKEFAAESEDLVTAIRKAGGAFKAASSDAQSSAQTFQQFIALFTAVRSTTRESADEIASGLRTIFGRLQSSQVVDNLRGMNIELRHTAEEASLAGKDIQGQFVGGFEAVKRLHEALRDVPTTSPQYAEIVKQVGGFRQVSRVLPLIQQFPLALKAYATAQTGANSLTDDATKAQGALLTRLTKLREEFVGLIRDVGNDKAFQRIGNTFLTLAETLLKLAKAAEPILPLLTAIAGVKIGKALFNFVIPGTQRGVTNVGGARAHAYSPTKKLRSGGPVYGHGIGDKVPDMLPPGSFVIKRSSVEAAGGHGVVRSWVGGGRGSDDRRRDIPVLLEPGEHKVMPHEARRVGYGNLHRLNKTGNLPRVRGYAEGGIATDDGENEIRIYAWNEYEKVKHVNEKSTVAERAQAWSAYEKLADFGLNSYDENRVPRIPPPPFPRPQKKGTTRSKSQPARQKTEKIIIPRSVQKTLDRSGLSEINFNRSVGEFRLDTPEEVDRIAGSPAHGVFDPIGNRVILRKSSGPDVVAHELTHSIDHSQGIYVPEEFASENADHPFGRAAAVAKDYFYTHPKSVQYVQSRTDTPPEYLAIAVGDYALRRHDNPDTFREALSAHPHGASVLRAVEDLFIPAAEKFYPRQRYASGGSVKRRYGFASGGLIPSIPATASSGVGATRKSLSREEIRRRYGFAGGGSVSPLAASGKITDPAVRKNFEALFAGEHASRVSDHIPEGSTFLAHGRDAVAFRRPDGDVVRVGGLGDEKFRAHDRPTDPDLMIQPKVSARYGDHLVEQLPYAPSLREQFGERFADPAVIRRVWKAFDRRARRRGKMAIDAHPGNLTYVKGVKGRLMAIDPRTYADRPTGNEPTVDMPPISAGLSPAPMGYARGGYVDLSRHPEERARRFMSKLRDTHIGSADEPTIRLASHYVNSSNPFNDPEHPLYDERRNDKLDRFLRSRRLPGAMVLHRGLSGEALQKWTGQWRPGKLAGSVASTGSRFTSTALLDKETASFGSLQLRINAAKGTPGALVNPHESEFLLPRHTNLRFGEFDRERNILHADIAHGYASGGVVMTPNGPVATSRDGITYQLDRDALLQGRRKPKNGTVQGVRLRRVEADPSTGALTPRANWYGKHRARRYARRLMGGMTAGGVVNSVRIGTPHSLRVKSRIMGSFHARGYAAGTDLGGLKDVPFGELAHWLQDYLDRDVLKHPAYKGQRGEVREATGLKPIPKKRVPYALAENLGYQYKKNEKIANRNLGNVDLSDEGQAKLAEIVGRAQLGGIDPFELAKVRQPKGRAASKAKAMRAATPPSPEVTSLIEAVSGLDDLDAMKELYRSDKNIIRTVSPLAKKITRDKLSAGEKREAYAQRKDQYAYLKDAYKKRIAELKARGDQYNRPVKSSVLVTGEDLPSSRQAGIANPSRVSDAGNRARKKVMAPAIVRKGESTPPLFKDVQDPETISAMVHTAGQRKGAPRPMTVAEADSLGEQYQQPQATPQVREGIRLKRRTTASQPTTSRTVDPTVVAEYRRRKAEEAEKYAELQRTAAAVREKVGGSSPLDIEGVRTYTKNVAYEQRKAATAQELARPYTPEEITAGKRSAASQQTPNRSPTPLIEQYYRSRQPDGPEGKYPVPAVISQRAKRSIFRGYPIAEPRPDVVRTSEGAIPLPGRTPLVTRTVRFGAGKMSRSSEERAVLRGAVLPYQLKRLAERHRPRAATPTPAPTTDVAAREVREERPPIVPTSTPTPYSPTPAPTPHVHETRPTEPVVASAADAPAAPSPTAMAAKTRTVQSRAARSTAAGAGGSKPPRQPRTRAGGAEPPGGDGTNREILAVLKSLLAETKGVRSSAKSTAADTKKATRATAEKATGKTAEEIAAGANIHERGHEPVGPHTRQGQFSFNEPALDTRLTGGLAEHRWQPEPIRKIQEGRATYASQTGSKGNKAGQRMVSAEEDIAVIRSLARPQADIGISRKTTREEYEQQRRAGRKVRAEREGKKMLGIAGGYRPTDAERQVASVAAAATPPAPPAAGRIAALAADREGLRERRRSPVPTPGFTGSERTTGRAPAQPLGKRVKEYVDTKVSKQGPMTPQAEAEFRKRTQREALRELQGKDVLAERQQVAGTTARSGRKRLRQILDVNDRAKPSLASRIFRRDLNPFGGTFGRVDADGSLARMRKEARRDGGRMGGFADRLGGHAGNLGFFASAFAPQILEHSYGTVDQPKGSVEQAKRGQAIGGALTYGGIGAQVGSTLGLPGAAVGLGAGAVYGFVAALKEAENRIEEIKFDKSFNSLRASLESAASGTEKLGDTTNQVVSSLLATSTGEAKRRTDAEGAGKNPFQRFFESVGGDPHEYDVFGLYTKSTEEAERDIGTQRGAKRAEILTPQLPQLQQIGERIASEVRLGSHEVTLPEGADQATIAARRESRIKSFQDAGGAQIAETISEIQHIPLRQVYENFDRIAVSANRLRVQQEGQTKVVTAATIEMVRFQEVGDAVRGAADSLHGLQAVSSGLASVFEGQIATAKVGGFSGAASNVGGLDREAFRKSVQFTTGQVGGASINEFGGVITDIDRAMRELPQAITHAPLNFGDADALKGGLAKVFQGGEGGVGGLNLPQSMLTRLSDAVEAMDPERLLKEAKGNPGKLAEELIKESFGDLPRAFADITKQVEERGGQFAEGLATFSQMLQKAGESRDLEGRAQLGVTQARAALAGSREGRASEDLVTLRQIQEPIRQRQERLAGGDAFNPEAIGGKLAIARKDVVAIQERINNVQDEPADQNDPTKRRKTLDSLLKEFNTASLKASNLQRALEHLADASDRSAAIQEKLNQVEKQRQGQLSYTEKLLTADPRQLFEMQRGAQAADVAVGQGGFEGFSAENVQSALEHLRSLENVRLPGYGNRTGGQVAERLIGGANREVFGDQAAGLERDRDSLLQQQVKIAQEAATAQKQLSDHFASTAHSFLGNLEQQNGRFLERMDTLIHEARLRDARGAEGRAEVTAKSKVQTVRSIEKLQGLASTPGSEVDLPHIRKIVSAPEFGAFRESRQRIQDLQRARSRLFGTTGVNGELADESQRHPGFAFGREFGQIPSDAKDPKAAADRLREHLNSAVSDIHKGTGRALSHEDIENIVIPKVMADLGRFQSGRDLTPQESLTKKFDAPESVARNVSKAMTDVQGAEVERFNSARKATAIHAFGPSKGQDESSYLAISRVAGNFDEINKSIGELPKHIRDLGDAVRDAGGAINKVMRTRKTREDVEQSKPPQVAETRASGGSIFRKRGTDTVPAMLTPGEFVVNAASTRKHLPMLRRINAGARYYADGGDVEDPFRKDVESFRPTEPIVPDIPATTMTAPTQVGEDIVRHQSEEAEYIRKRIAEIWGTPMRARTTPAEVQAPANVVGDEPRRSPTPDSPPTPPTPPTPLTSPTPPQAIPPALPQVPSLPDAIASIPSPTTPGSRRKHSEEVLVPALGRAVAADQEASEAKRQSALALARQYDERRKAKRAENMMGVEAIPPIVVPKISPRESKGKSVSYGGKDNAYFADLERNIGLANQQETPFSRSALANAEKAAVVLDRKIERYQRAGMTRHAEKASGLLASLGRSNIYNALEQERSSRKALGGPSLSQVQSPSRATVRDEQDYQSRRTSFLAGVGGGTQVSYVANQKPKKRPIGLTRSQHRAMQAMVFGPEMTNTRTPRVNTALSGGGLVPSMVSPGEFVVNARSARANAGVLSQINAGTPEYHQAGGVVGGSVAGVAAPGIHLSSGVKSTLDRFTSRFSDAVSGLGGSLGRLSSSAASLAGSLGGFNDAASSLARALSSVSIPSKIEVSSRNEVVVTLNGGAVIAAIKGDTATAVMEAIQQQLPEQVRKIVDSLPPRA